ncbi:MAG: ABC transporter ATP-binding protein [Alphaproteobacteria bacterium]|nr:ABC transporter ATP-binding protein [Alphaproteobacteria bacterium]
MAEPLLTVTGVVKRFGGIAASDGVDLAVGGGECHALIGPNGAGKTTLIAEIAGELAPDAGTIVFDGADITGEPAPRRARLGLARSFQVTCLIPTFTALENASLAIQARQGHSFRFWRQANRDASLAEPAMAALARVGLEARSRVSVGALAHGEQRALEIALALALEPRLLLLDEPMAGMGPADAARMIGLLESLKGRVTMLLVEHDMDAVFRLADRISVLVYGKVIASGRPEDVRADAEVRRAYLGEDA